MSNGIDYPLGETVHILFTTRQFSTGAPFTLAGTPALAVYENESVTQITAGVSLGVDHDSVTGLNLATIVATGANGYESGKSYHVVITTGTVDSVSVVGEVVGWFSVERSAGYIRLGAPAGASVSADIASIQTDTTAIVADTNELQTDWADGGRLDLILDARASQTTADAIEVDTQDIQTQIGTAGAGLTNINLPDQTMNITGNVTGSLSGSVGSVTGNVGGSVGSLGTTAKADVNAEVLDVLNTDTFAEPSAVPAATATLAAKLNWLAALARNKQTQTSTTTTLRNDADSGNIATSTISDDGTTFTRGEWT